LTTEAVNPQWTKKHVHINPLEWDSENVASQIKGQLQKVRTIFSNMQKKNKKVTGCNALA